MKQFIPQALRTSAVVGSILVSINQFEAVYGDASLNMIKVGLTYMVPFMVYMYSAISNTKASKSAPDKVKPVAKAMPQHATGHAHS